MKRSNNKRVLLSMNSPTFIFIVLVVGLFSLNFISAEEFGFNYLPDTFVNFLNSSNDCITLDDTTGRIVLSFNASCSNLTISGTSNSTDYWDNLDTPLDILTMGNFSAHKVSFTGNVGIGTATPSTKLEVNASSTSSLTLRGLSPAIDFAIERATGVGWASDLINPTFQNISGGTKNNLGSVGYFGTVPNGILSYMWFGTSTNTDYETNHNFRLYPDQHIEFDGNVGIGTATTPHPLNVNGTGNFTGNVSVGENLDFGGGASLNSSGGSIITSANFVVSGSTLRIGTDVDITRAGTNLLRTPDNVEMLGTVKATGLLTSDGGINIGGTKKIDMNTGGFGAPTFNTHSAGTKLLLWDSISSTKTGNAIGIEAGAVWMTLSQASDSQYFKWYGGTTEAMKVSGIGNLETTGNVTAPFIIADGSLLTNTPNPFDQELNTPNNTLFNTVNSTENMNIGGNASIVGASIKLGDAELNALSGSVNTLQATNNFRVLNIMQIYGALAVVDSRLAAWGTGSDYYIVWSKLSAIHSLVQAIDTAGGGAVIFADKSDVFKDFDHVAQTHPTKFFQSETDPDTDNTQWFSMHHNTTDAFFDMGTAGGSFIFNGTTKIKENLVVDGNITGDSYHAEMYVDVNNGSTVEFATQNVWVQIKNFSIDETNGFTLNDLANLTADVGSDYQLNGAISFTGATGSTHAFAMGINGTIHTPTYIRRKLGSQDAGALSITGIVDISNGNDIGLFARDEDVSLNDIQIISANFNVVRVGN